MAITNNSKLISAINKQSNSTDPGCGCGAVIIGEGELLPAGDYVAFQPTEDNGLIDLDTIVFKGAPIENASGTPIIAFRASARTGTTFWHANIESCRNRGANPIVFFKRCK